MRFWPSCKRPLAGLDQDIRDHIELETSENIERGMTPEDARAAALRKFGNVTRIQEDTRAVWTSIWLEQALQDLRYALRMFRAHPGFTLVVIATLALGIGMNTAVFSVLNTVLFLPLPYPHAGRLIWLANFNQQDQRDNWVARTDYLIWKDQARSFEKMTAYGNDDMALVANDEASQERIASITGDFWEIGGAQPAAGRLFHSGEPNAIVLSWALFERRFNADARAIGKIIIVNGWPFTITGVLPKDFRFLFPQQFFKGDEVRDIDAYIPIPDAIMAMPPAGGPRWEAATKQFGPAPFWIVAIGRLRPNASFESAHSEMEAIYTRIAKQFPDPVRAGHVLHFATLQEKLAGGTRRPLIILLVAVGFVLLIACANIANLLLARASTRQREIAIRAAMGAGRARVIRQFLAESVLLALFGCAAGVALARWALAVLVRLAPDAVPRLAETTIDARVLFFTLAISILAGLMFGLAPAVAAWRTEVSEVLKTDTGTASAASGRIRFRAVLAGAELALAIILLAGAGLMFKSFWRMNARPAGFAPEKILVMRITLTGPQYPTWPMKQAYAEELLRKLESVPGVASVGIDAGTLNTNIKVDGAAPVTPGNGIFAAIRGVSAHYLRAMGSPLVRGSWPPRDGLSGVVVNEAFAQQLAVADATSKHLAGPKLNDPITGVVADFKTWQLDAKPWPEVYIPYERMSFSRSMRVIVRTAGNPSAIAASIRQVASGIDHTQPIYEFQTLAESLASSIAPHRFNMFLLGTFATTAMLLALIGIYGVIAYSVSQRTREIGIRLALGAARSEIVGMVVRQGMTLALAGIATGTLAALGLTRLMASLLYDVKPNDPWTFAAVALSLAGTAFIASAAPAFKAARVDPLAALRQE